MYENLNIRICTTAAGSPRSNGLVERHNAVLGNMSTKIMAEQSCSLEVAGAWAISTKNSLQNVHEFSPNQLVFGSNQNFPNVMNNAPTASEGKTTSQIVAENLNAMHSAIQAFIQSESAEKLRRALKHHVRISDDTKYFAGGDTVCYKRKDDACNGPGTVTGQEGNQILVKHGSVYIRVHPCRLKFKNKNSDIR